MYPMVCQQAQPDASSCFMPKEVQCQCFSSQSRSLRLPTAKISGNGKSYIIVLPKQNWSRYFGDRIKQEYEKTLKVNRLIYLLLVSAAASMAGHCYSIQQWQTSNKQTHTLLHLPTCIERKYNEVYER